MLWAADLAMRPTLRNLTDSFETWASRNGHLRDLQRLEARRWIERDKLEPDQRLYRLSELGRLQVLGGRDPEVQWSRSWDGVWRMVMFDVAIEERGLRDRVRYFLRTRHFGCLQQSVWVAPEMHSDDITRLGTQVDTRALIFMEGRPFAGESDQQIVQAAWNFEAINSRYSRYLACLEKVPNVAGHQTEAGEGAFRNWAAKERKTWSEAVARDPMLPAALLPKGYLGRRAWERRKEVCQSAASQLQRQ
jgi:phenylacetic acid degradation operon negative regulatory protein